MNKNDQRGLEALRKANVDLNVPHRVRHYFYLGNKPKADLLSGKISEQHFSAEVRSGVEQGTWLVLATRNYVLSDELVANIRVIFDELAHNTGAEYDGWEVEVSRATPEAS